MGPQPPVTGEAPGSTVRALGSRVRTGLLTGANPSHGGTSIGISEPHSTTSPADEFVCGTDQMEFLFIGAVAATSAMLLVLSLAIVLVVRRRQKA